MRIFADTSALLNGCANRYEEIWVSPLTVTELENIKTSKEKSEHIKYLARQIVRDILFNEKYKTWHFSEKRIDKYIKKHPTLNNINDHRIIACAALLQKDFKNDINFITSDGAQYLAAWNVNIHATFFEPCEEKITEYCGWKIVRPTNEQLAELYSHPENNIFAAKTNEFVEIYIENELKDIQFWNGNKYCSLNYNPIKNKFLNETIKPRNLEQKMAFHLLQNPDIKVKLLVSAWGGGKTMIALNYALEQISKGYYNKLVFVRNNIIVADTNDLGFMPGDLKDKMSIWSAVIADHLGGQEMLDQFIDDDIIEVFPLSHIRGRSIRKSIVICDECENLTDSLVTLLLSRIEEDSEIIFCGDIAQIDNKKFEIRNGVRALIKNLAGEPLFGMVKLIKSERGPVPRLCDKIRPPV